MKNSERLVYFFTLHIGVNKQAASPPPAEQVFRAIEAEWKGGRALLEVNRETATIEINDMRFDTAQNLVTIHMRFADKNGADVYFADIDAKTSRVERKQPGEGRGFGAHLTVSLAHQKATPNVYLALLEKSNGVSSSFVVRLLQSVLRNLYGTDPSSFMCDDISGARDRSGKAKQVSFRPMLDLNGLPSDQFISDLEEGKLQEIHLIEQVEESQFGARPWLSEKERVVKLNAKAGAPGVGAMWQSLKNLFSDQSKKGYARARIKFKRVDGEPDTVDIDAETGALLDQRYVKSKRFVDINPHLDECSDAIVNHFAALIEADVIANRS